MTTVGSSHERTANGIDGLGQTVVLSKKFGPREGTRGTVEGIERPYERGRTTDIFDVILSRESWTTSLKFEGLR